MRGDAGWHAPHQVKAEVDPLSPAKLCQRILQAPGAVLTAEFPRDKLCAGNAAGWDIRIEQKGPPDQFRNDIWPGAQGTAQPPDAQIAPGADQIESDFNIQPRLEGCQDIHNRSLAQPRRAGSPFFGSRAYPRALPRQLCAKIIFWSHFPSRQVSPLGLKILRRYSATSFRRRISGAQRSPSRLARAAKSSGEAGSAGSAPTRL